MRCIILPFGLAAFLFSNPIFAQAPYASAREAASLAAQNEPAGSLDLDQAMRLATDANPDLAVARRERDAVTATREQAALFRNPEISVDVEDTRSSRRQTTYWLGQPLELGGKRGARIESAERAIDLAGAELDIRFASVRAAVIQSFHDVLAAQENLRLAGNSMELAQRGLDVARRRVLAGKVSPVEETRARVAATGAGIELNQARAILENARKRLSALWGNPTPRFTEAVGALEILPALPSLAALYERVENAPEALRARREIGLREAMLKVEEAKRYPDLVVRGGIQRDEATGERINLVGIAMALPIFDRNQGNIYEAKTRVEKARDEETAIRVRLRADLAQAHQRLAAALHAVSNIRNEILPGAQKALDATTRGFELGKFGFLDVLDAQRTLFLARGQYVQALGEAQRAVAEVENLLGPRGEALFILPDTKYRG